MHNDFNTNGFQKNVNVQSVYFYNVMHNLNTLLQNQEILFGPWYFGKA